MADERQDAGDPKKSREGGGEPSDESQARRLGGRHRGYRGRHGGKPSGPDQQGQRDGPRQPRDGGLSRGDQGQRNRPATPEEARNMPVCPICGKPVYDLSTALSASRESGDPAHFDCVLERVGDSESLGPGEKLVYLGSGSFGVVEFKDRNESVFTVKRRIQWEKEGEKKDWRKGLSSRIANL